ncbi:small s protein [Cercophora scortea]|uniref:Small s protein n=1 Tax=Cercophora scortea TaxID=314031 RepID=A0AAE0M5I5_9PEZI|nr:small s protein [Cercophora scortea]
MDPFVATSLAGNIIQFVLWAKAIYVQVREVQKSAIGLTKRHEEITWSATELQTIVDRIAAGTEAPDPARPNERRIHELGQQCQALAKELVNDLQTAGTASKGRPNFFRAAHGVLKGSRGVTINGKPKTLERVESALFKHLIAHISDQQTGVTRSVMGLAEQNQRLEASRTKELDELKNQVLRALSILESFDASSQPPKSRDKELGELPALLAQWGHQAEMFKREQSVIKSLQFDGMLQRQQDIPNHHLNTFQWVFDPRLRFKNWLDTKTGVYWISGSPGSGKSTLMKYLSTDQGIHQSLEEWAGPKTLVKASFYFWYSGTSLQKSQDGLLRSLLLEILRQHPASIPVLCPERWSSTLPSPWDRQELMATLKRLDLHSSSMRFCFFIDGLDEYRGPIQGGSGADPSSHVSEVIDVIQSLSGLTDIKLCISSRPWVLFERAFGRVPERKLYVHEENKHDIRLYIEDKLEKSDVFLESQIDRDDLKLLVEDVVENSRGVFLWVFLVIGSLLRGLANHDRPAELRRRLSQIPTTLVGYFERMLDSVEDIYQEQAAQILQTSLHAVEPLYVVTYFFIGDEDPTPICSPIRPWNTEECISISSTGEVRIKVRCPDLLRITRPGGFPTTAQKMTEHRVDFLHQTVRDFLVLDDTQSLIQQRMAKPFDAGAYICRSLLTQLKAVADVTPLKDDEATRALLDDITFYARDCEVRTGTPQMELLDELQRVLATHIGRGAFSGDDWFLGYAVQKNLQLYVAAKLETLPDTTRYGWSLLDCALRPFIHSRYIVVPSARVSMPASMISTLLEHGASPNQVLLGTGKYKSTVWERYIEHISIKREGMAKNAELRDEHIAIMRALLEHGAGPSSRYPASELLERIQAWFSPDERAYIEMLILKSQKEGGSSLFSAFFKNPFGYFASK